MIYQSYACPMPGTAQAMVEITEDALERLKGSLRNGVFEVRQMKDASDSRTDWTIALKQPVFNCDTCQDTGRQPYGLNRSIECKACSGKAVSG
ncbi:MAG: hypothetical protein CML13_16060 [Puniceicoccaceae bacterium]|nr:hypothetical protein [Puniceicoccaceae bacterium]